MHSALGSRDQRSAALTAAALLSSGGGALLLDQAFTAISGEPTSVTSTVTGAVIAVLGLSLFRWHAGLPDELWMVFTILMLGTILVLNIATNDTGGGGAQLAFLLPVVYASAFLRPMAAWAVAATAAVTSAVSAFTLIPFERAVGEYPFLFVSIFALNSVLLASGRRQDRLVAQLDALASVDSLTGLATRRALTEKVAAALDVAQDEAPEGTGLMILDVDRFKLINDTLGHPTGDAVLAHLGQVLRTSVRQGDTVARFGGDEFAVLLPGTSAEDAFRRADELRLTIRQRPLTRDGLEVPLTMSVGVAHEPGGRPDLEGLYIAADQALYRAKQDGRDRVELGLVDDVPWHEAGGAGVGGPGGPGGGVS